MGKTAAELPTYPYATWDWIERICTSRSSHATVREPCYVPSMGEMTYRPLGDSGLMVSAVGIGCNQFGRKVDLAELDAITAA